MAKPKQATFPEVKAAFAEQDKKLKEWCEQEQKALEAILKPWDDGYAKLSQWSVKL